MCPNFCKSHQLKRDNTSQRKFSRRGNRGFLYHLRSSLNFHKTNSRPFSISFQSIAIQISSHLQICSSLRVMTVDEKLAKVPHRRLNRLLMIYTKIWTGTSQRHSLQRRTLYKQAHWSSTHLKLIATCSDRKYRALKSLWVNQLWSARCEQLQL